jgi:hypothetical protein
MSGFGDEEVTNITNVNETNETVIGGTLIEEAMADSDAAGEINISQWISLEEAVDSTGLLWTTGGDAEWFGQADTYYYDDDAAESGDINDNEETWMGTTVSGPDTLLFYWKVSSESDCDFLTFYIDGVEQDSISGDTLWMQKTYLIDSGLHTLTWEYTKDGSVTIGEDCGWVDEVEIGVPGGDICQAIEEGVAWLVRQQNADGSWGTDYPVAKTAFAVLKLETHATDPKPPDGCGYGLASPFDPAYPYADNVAQGLDYIFANAYTIDIGTQTHDGSVDNPDTNSNGKGVYFSGRRTYETSIAMMAIAASTTPDRIVNVPGSAVDGWTYKDALQDTVDYLAWGQTDSGYGRGGWIYEEMDNEGDISDNSNTGYAVLGLAYAEAKPPYGFSLTVPAFVKDELNIWIDYIQNDVDGDTNDGGSGYTDPDNWVNILKTGNLLYEMAYVGDTRDTLDYLARHWNDANSDPGWKGVPDGVAHYQAMYTTMKGLEAFKISKIDDIDWFNDFSNVIVAQQQGDGLWLPGDWGDSVLNTEWALLTLQKVVVPPPPPCIPCVSIEVDVSINNNNGAIPYWPWNVFRYNVSVTNNQAYKPSKSRIAITYGLIDDPTSHTLIIGTRMPDIYLNDTYNISGDFMVPDDVYSGNYVFFASAFDMETGCCGCNAVPFSVEMPPWWISTTSKEESWENWLEIVED